MKLLEKPKLSFGWRNDAVSIFPIDKGLLSDLARIGDGNHVLENVHTMVQVPALSKYIYM